MFARHSMLSFPTPWVPLFTKAVRHIDEHCSQAALMPFMSNKLRVLQLRLTVLGYGYMMGYLRCFLSTISLYLLTNFAKSCCRLNY